MIIAAVVGHDTTEKTYQQIRADLRRAFKLLTVEGVISGMSLGVEQVAVEEALQAGLFVAAAIPVGHTDYHKLLSHVTHVEVFGENYPPAERNHWMVDKADVVIGVWNGPIFSDNVTECIKYARTEGKPFYWIEPKKQIRGYRWNDDVPEEDRKDFALYNLIDHRIERKYEAGIKIERWEADAYSPERTELLCAKYPRLFRDTGETKSVGFPFSRKTKVYEFIEDNGLW